MSFKNNVFVFAMVYLSYYMGQATATTAAELKAKYSMYVLDCSKEHSVTAAEIKDLVKNGNTEKENIKCMLSCSLKKTGMVDDEGKLSAEGVRKVAALVYADKPKLMEQSEDFLKACLSVNDEEVSDKKECERAALIFKCSVDNNARAKIIMILQSAMSLMRMSDD